MTQQPWRGIHVAAALPFNDDLSIDFDAWAAEVAWLAENGMDGVTPNGSLGEYQTLTPEERYKVVSIATEVAPEGFRVMAGCGAYGALESVRAEVSAAIADGAQVIILSDTFYEFADPLMRQLGRPTLMCHKLVTDADGFVAEYRLRQPDQKRHAVNALLERLLQE